MAPLTPELAKTRDAIRGYALDLGLDFFEVVFEVLDWKEMNAVAAYGGFPNRYPHWRFGMEYEHLSKSYAYGLTKIYEMVINNDPCYAYLLYSNSMVDQKLVMAHVYGHSDFFKNNVYFAQTNRKMIDEFGNHRTKIQRLINQYGADRIEDGIDRVLSLENLIDVHRPAIRRQEGRVKTSAFEYDEEPEEAKLAVKKLKSKDYMESFINPAEFLEAQRKKVADQVKREKGFPESPEQDILLFLIENAPLERWEREVLSIVREEAYYFAPQSQTKIMNEGWAAYHHSKIMTTRALRDSEIIEYADHHSGTLAPSPGKLNPYKLGMELFRDIEERWNKGQFGPEYETCQDMRLKTNWDRKLGMGQEKVFEVRRLYNDITFLDSFLTEDFCKEQKFFQYGFNNAAGTYEIIDRDYKKVKAKLLERLTNIGNPQIQVVDGNASNRGELILKHHHEGVDLRLDWAWQTLQNLQGFWRRPVHIETIIDGIPKVLSYDGTERKEQRLG